MNVRFSSFRERGAAIVLAMGVVAVAAIAASGIMVTQSTWARHGELKVDHVQAQAVVMAGVDWARAVLGDDRRLGAVDHLGEPWALRLQPMPLENGQLSGYVEDQQGLFNLNNLVRDGKVERAQFDSFCRLLALLGLPVALADALVDWLDENGVAESQGAEDAYYLALQPPYFTANRALADLGELAMVRGFDRNVRSRLSPFVTALPRFTAVNVNTAPPEVLAAIVPGLGLDGARSLVAKRASVHFRNPADFIGELPRESKGTPPDIGVSSDYFLAHVAVSVGSAEARGVALLARGGGAWPSVVWRKLL
jgi:general secretion pathway protein K